MFQNHSQYTTLNYVKNFKIIVKVLSHYTTCQTPQILIKSISEYTVVNYFILLKRSSNSFRNIPQGMMLCPSNIHQITSKNIPQWIVLWPHKYSSNYSMNIPQWIMLYGSNSCQSSFTIYHSEWCCIPQIVVKTLLQYTTENYVRHPI